MATTSKDLKQQQSGSVYRAVREVNTRRRCVVCLIIIIYLLRTHGSYQRGTIKHHKGTEVILKLCCVECTGCFVFFKLYWNWFVLARCHWVFLTVKHSELCV